MKDLRDLNQVAEGKLQMFELNDEDIQERLEVKAEGADGWQYEGEVHYTP